MESDKDGHASQENRRLRDSLIRPQSPFDHTLELALRIKDQPCHRAYRCVPLYCWPRKICDRTTYRCPQDGCSRAGSAQSSSLRETAVSAQHP